MQGKHTHEQFLRVIHKDEKTDKGPADMPIGEPIGTPTSSAPAVYDMETGDRSIKRGAHQESEHNKHRADD